MYLLVLPESGDALLIWPDGHALRVRRDGSTVPSMLASTDSPACPNLQRAVSGRKPPGGETWPAPSVSRAATTQAAPPVVSPDHDPGRVDPETTGCGCSGVHLGLTRSRWNAAHDRETAVAPDHHARSPQAAQPGVPSDKTGAQQISDPDSTAGALLVSPCSAITTTCRANLPR